MHDPPRASGGFPLRIVVEYAMVVRDVECVYMLRVDDTLASGQASGSSLFVLAEEGEREMRSRWDPRWVGESRA